MATEDWGCTATIISPREMDLWLTKVALRLILGAEDLRVSVEPELDMGIMLALVGLFMVMLAMLAMVEVEVEAEVEAEEV